MNEKRLFNGRSEVYSNYRPGYPEEVISSLEANAELKQDSVVADIGSGTGIFSKLFLSYGNFVYCVEPNADMRNKAKEFLSSFNNYELIDGNAENTHLLDRSVDFVVGAQSFHWFDPELSKKEFNRILRPGGKVVLLWNNRISKPDSFNEAYENIIRKFSPEYHGTGSLSVNEEIIGKFFDDNFLLFNLSNLQKLSLDGVQGRYFSNSYAIGPGNPDYKELLNSLKMAFNKYDENGFVCLDYETKIYVGTLKHNV
ncbi:class I SAM-dependent methyltransferase [Ferroplasma sp.]|uniref:class I SAM-dependent methyltransferase n=1 Tax=Ferroplasma sp. TaxID=2591003 RepID=UPI0026177920|nr:class I SAM-dependent methyltransferase [Ferroplasma sp.]